MVSLRQLNIDFEEYGFVFNGSSKWKSFLHQTKKMHKLKDRIYSQFNNICFIDIQDYSFFDIIYS